jgi:hypothetical protein
MYATENTTKKRYTAKAESISRNASSLNKIIFQERWKIVYSMDIQN